MYGTWDPSWDFQHVQVMLNKTSSLLDLLGTIFRQRSEFVSWNEGEQYTDLVKL